MGGMGFVSKYERTQEGHVLSVSADAYEGGEWPWSGPERGASIGCSWSSIAQLVCAITRLSLLAADRSG